MAEEHGDGTPGTPTGGMLSLKRPRGTPTFQTPRRPRKRAPLREIVAQEGEAVPARRLSFDAAPQSWSGVEVKALVEFVLFHSTGERWPTHKQTVFWSNAAEFVKKRARTSHVRSGKFFILIFVTSK